MWMRVYFELVDLEWLGECVFFFEYFVGLFEKFYCQQFLVFCGDSGSVVQMNYVLVEDWDFCVFFVDLVQVVVFCLDELWFVVGKGCVFCWVQMDGGFEGLMFKEIC